MPAQSKQQQKFMGIVRAIQKGDAPASKFSKAARDAAKDMSKSDVKKYAKTKHKGLPRKVKQELLDRLKKEYAFYHRGTFSKKRDHDDDNNLGKKKKHSGQPDLEENVVKNHDGKAAPYGSGYKKVDDEEINEIGIFPITNYIKGMIPPGRLDVIKKGDKEKAIALIKDLVYTLNDFWKSNKIPFRVREPRKSDMNKFKQKNKRF